MSPDNARDLQLLERLGDAIRVLGESEPHVVDPATLASTLAEWIEVAERLHERVKDELRDRRE